MAVVWVWGFNCFMKKKCKHKWETKPNYRGGVVVGSNTYCKTCGIQHSRVHPTKEDAMWNRWADHVGEYR